MAQIIKPKKNRLEIADILRKHIGDYQNQYPLWPEHHKIVFDLLNCRTAALGGHIDRCSHCGTMRIFTCTVLWLAVLSQKTVPAGHPAEATIFLTRRRCRRFFAASSWTL